MPACAPSAPLAAHMRLYYSHDPNPRVAVAVARYLGAAVVFVRTHPRSLKNERSADALGAEDPCAPVPMLVEASRTLWETDAIACRLSWLAKADLWPNGDLAPELQTWLAWGRGFTRAASALQRQQQRLQESQQENEHESEQPQQQGPAHSPASEPNGEQRAASEAPAAAFHRFAAVLEDVLCRRSWLIDNRLTYADFRVATALPFALGARLPLGGYANILKWHERLCCLSAWARPWPDPDGGGPIRSPKRPDRSAGGRRRGEGEPVAVHDAVVDAADELAIAHQGNGLEWLEARSVRGDPLGGEFRGRPGHEH